MDQARALSMVRTMADMQDRHNRHVHPDWRNQGYEYYRAVWVECAELLDHFGWKWWKRQKPDLDQVKLEIVDIWHFGLSDLIRAGALNEAAPQLLEHALAVEAEHHPERFRLAVEALAQETLTLRAFAVAPFAEVLVTLPLPFAELFEMYVGKNVLNNFRQDHGYKAGRYVKLWHGREDNEHLVELLRGLDCPAEEVPEALYSALAERYPA